MHWDEPLMVSRAERLQLETNSEDMSFGQIFWQMWWCSGSMIAQLDLFWPSSWHVNFHFCLLGVSVNHIFF